ncbi:hypothetical protein E1301_Tti011204 [Triplophysa tibetana]|uniref:Uncharacterized protein n=1 Tax=Triplophysa tibetana TaxID=1572043 RepID=A0A5A9MZB4_9TELE|nr:hypothetical protein E1301_Tti011204 [Triplophysa tibetana]
MISRNYKQKRRMAVEEFCTRLKNLFCIGLITLLGYTVMEGFGAEEELRQTWGKKMKVVQSRIDEVIEDCINSFLTQADLDAEHIVISPEPIDDALILTLIPVLEQNKCIFKKSSMAMTAEQLFVTVPHCVVHTVKTSCKDLGFSCSFSDELHYSIKFENVFIHFENRTENRKPIVNS